MIPKPEGMQLKIEQNLSERIDKLLIKKISYLTRSKIQELIKAGNVKVNTRTIKPSYKPKSGDIIEIELPEVKSPPIKSKIDLKILYEDDQIIAINKEAGIVSHPAGRYLEGTLLQGIYNYLDEKGELPELMTSLFKPTLLHRLDKDTSGVILAAKTLDAYYNIQKQFLKRTVYKEYWCIVEGNVKFDSDLIAKKIGKSNIQFAKMVISSTGKEAETIYKVIKRFSNFSLLCAIPKTGRTHQIRIHLASIGHPILCDSIYGRRKMLYRWQIDEMKLSSQRKILNAESIIERDKEDIPLISRQALHAKKIQFIHPKTAHIITIEAPLPQDFEKVLEYLEKVENIPLPSSKDK